MNDLTWSCHVCGKVRPDAEIDVAVATGTLPASGAPVAVNQRYCKDDPDCKEAAQERADTLLAHIIAGGKISER